ncbi:hypothetical protein Kpol_1039p17 [Vanderwaltozyma polyspora DSM 70294]|uniref:NADPH-dependent 1-acyldihydroxyacetone phosphate reductase n=1 Tax=Vanderwaltozyma polyspora (strain ATCC 22028 / DSM 70294 / BCRC 21397 / CBS 2163 / NBRC 10782 / NRRL Y-8283 / UCD 57-17) TaxID=436907 RepID=A7THE4_VANPO|nr:uncharacterized protein Kpol_1039p17 [Vanderwaltozyma polyspora DSM 70294]EDO18268.1 hypothetical protein Kpol_1039p17 [Vanderwaltozyma polyspora DSM 70294]
MSEEKERIALVTGASSGIGFAVTQKLASKGFKVYACARRTLEIEPLVRLYPNKVIATKIDISNEEEILELRERLSEELPDQKLDVLYNNAGQSCTFPALDVTDAAMKQCFDVNVFGHVNMCRELSKFLIRAKGTIVFTGSIAGIITFPFGSIYSASKAAIHQYARGLHLELKPFNVRVINAITGGVNTNIADTRPLPSGSIFNFEEGIEAFQNRQLMAKRNNPMSADEYAELLVKDILSSKDPVDVYRGTFARFMSYVQYFVPYWLLEYALIKKFKLGKVFTALSSKSKRE